MRLYQLLMEILLLAKIRARGDNWIVGPSFVEISKISCSYRNTIKIWYFLMCLSHVIWVWPRCFICTSLASENRNSIPLSFFLFHTISLFLFRKWNYKQAIVSMLICMYIFTKGRAVTNVARTCSPTLFLYNREIKYV